MEKINQETMNGSSGKERMFGNNSRAEFNKSSEPMLETLVGGLMAQPAPAPRTPPPSKMP